KNPDAKNVYANVFLMFGYGMAVLGAMLMLFAPEALMIFTTPEYYDAAWVAGILGYNLIFIGYSYIAIVAISITKNTKPYGIAMLYATILTIILNVLLIPHFGKEGSALATVFAQILVPVYLFYKGQKVFYIPYKFGEVISITVGMLVLVVAVRLVPFENLGTQIFVKIIISIILISIALFIRRHTLKTLIDALKKQKINPDTAIAKNP
ncbi:MAG: polysaccharide biosynthesis C-terminal domain-containing protein, partial [Ginsengibacter sp.]